MVSSYQIQVTVIREVLDHVGRRFDPLKLPGRFPPLFEDFSSGGVAGGNPLRSWRGFRGAGQGDPPPSNRSEMCGCFSDRFGRGGRFDGESWNGLQTPCKQSPISRWKRGIAGTPL